jgi:transcriptional regulator with XRE-family HTH domain
MSEGLGAWLRRAREARQLTLEDAEHTLRIRRRYLQALEMGDYTALPGEIQARGFLRNYARFLNLPTDEALARYDAEVQGRPMQPRARPVAESRPPIVDRPSNFPPPPSEEEETARIGAMVPSGLFQGVLVALGFFTLILVASYVGLQFLDLDAPADTATVTVAAPTATVAPQATPQATPAFPVSADGLVRLRLEPQEHAWINISADGQIVFQGIAEPGQSLEAAASETLIVSTGNGGAFDLYLNGTDWGALGEQGEVVRRAWSPQGEIDIGGLESAQRRPREIAGSPIPHTEPRPL